MWEEVIIDWAAIEGVMCPPPPPLCMQERESKEVMGGEGGEGKLSWNVEGGPSVPLQRRQNHVGI